MVEVRHDGGLSRSGGLEGQVSLRCGMRGFLPGHRTYVHASCSESSFAMIEAMSTGFPIGAGTIPTICEHCDDGVQPGFWSLDHPAQTAATLLDCESAR